MRTCTGTLKAESGAPNVTLIGLFVATYLQRNALGIFRYPASIRTALVPRLTATLLSVRHTRWELPLVRLAWSRRKWLLHPPLTQQLCCLLLNSLLVPQAALLSITSKEEFTRGH